MALDNIAPQQLLPRQDGGYFGAGFAAIQTAEHLSKQQAAGHADGIGSILPL